MGKGLIIMAKHAFLKMNLNIGGGHSITFYKRSFVYFAWKMTMLRAFPAKRQIRDSPCTLAIKWEIKKMTTKSPTIFFWMRKKTPIVWSDNTLKTKRGVWEHPLCWFRLWNSGHIPRLEMGQEMTIRTKNEGIKNPLLYIASSKNQNRQIFNEITPAWLIKKSLSLFLHIYIHIYVFFISQIKLFVFMLLL